MRSSIEPSIRSKTISTRPWTFGEAKKQAAKTCSAKSPDAARRCMEQQFSQHYREKGVNDSTVLRADSAGNSVAAESQGYGYRQ